MLVGINSKNPESKVKEVIVMNITNKVTNTIYI